MPALFRRIRLLFWVLRYGLRLLWLTAPPGHRLGWTFSLLAQLHADTPSGASAHAMLPRLGPLAGAFAERLRQHPELVDSTLHDAIDAVSHLETPLPPHEVARVLSAGLGHPLDTLFTSIDLLPARNGFAEQTHLARLAAPPHGRPDVVIKLVRTAQVEQIGDEAALLCWLARWLERSSRAARRLQLHTLGEAFARDLTRRFDLRAEAANLSQTGHHFDNDVRIAVPAVLWDYCTDHILTLERIETLAATDLEGLRAHGIDLAALAAHIVEIVVQQAFEHGFFHAAFDASRVRVSIEPATLGRLVLADFAVMSSLSTHERDFFVHGASALFDQDYERLAELHRHAGHVPSDARPEMLAAELRARSEEHFAGPQHERSAGGLLRHLLAAVQVFEGEVSPRLSAAHRALAQAEALAKTLHPGVDTWRIARDALKRIARLEMGHRGWLRHLAKELPHLAQIMPRMPRLVAHRLQQQHDDAAARQRAQLLHELVRESRRTRALLWTCAVFGVLLGMSYVWLGR